MPHLEGATKPRRRRRRTEQERAAENLEQRFFQSESVQRQVTRERLTREAAARTPAARAALDQRTRERAGIMGAPAPETRMRTTPAERRRARQERRAAKDAEMAQNLQDRDRRREHAQSRKIERRNRIRAKLGLPPLPGTGGGGGGRHALSTPIQVESTETFDRRTVRPGEFVRTPDGQVSQFIVSRGVETFVPFTTGPTGALIPDVDQIDFPAFEETLPFHERRDLGALAIDSQTDFGTRIRGIHRERNAIIDAIDLTGEMTEAQAEGPRADLDRREAQILFDFIRSGAADKARQPPEGQRFGDIWTDHGLVLTRTEQGVKKLDKVAGADDNLKLAQQAYKNLAPKKDPVLGTMIGEEPTLPELQTEMVRLQAIEAMTQRVAESMQSGAAQPELPSLPGRTLPIGQKLVGEEYLPAPISKEEMDQLPSGTRFYAPDGTTRTAP